MSTEDTALLTEPLSEEEVREQDGIRWMESASDKEVQTVLRLSTNEAQKRGLIPAPTEAPQTKPREPDPHYPGFYKPG